MMLKNKDKEEKGLISLHLGGSRYVYYKRQKNPSSPDREETKIKYQLIGENDEFLTPPVDNIIYDEEKKVLLYEDSIHLENGTSITFRFMSDLNGKQIGFVQNDYESAYDEIILLSGNYEKDKIRFENYKCSLKERIQSRIDRNKEDYIKHQNRLIALYTLERKI